MDNLKLEIAKMVVAGLQLIATGLIELGKMLIH